MNTTSLAVYLISIGLLSGALFLTLAFRRPLRPLLPIAVFALLAFVLQLGSVVVRHDSGFDFAVFWTAGRLLIAGENPYGAAICNGLPFMNPLPGLPLCKLFAAISYRAGELLWLFANAGLTLLLIPLAEQVLQGDRAHDVPRGRLDGVSRFVVAVAFCTTYGSYDELRIGQLSVLTTGLIFGAIICRDRGRPMLAGLLLALAIAKIQTLIPFLFLFLRRGDEKVWVSMILFGIGLAVLGAAPTDWSTLIAKNLRIISDAREGGRINDYSAANPLSGSLIGFDRLAYCLGLRDRGTIRLVQLLGSLALAAWLLRQVGPGSRIPVAGAAAVVSCGAMLFLYHRYYDASVLAIPLVYTLTRLDRAEGRERLALLVATGALLIIPQLPNAFFLWFDRHTAGFPLLHTLVSATILPLSIWLSLIAMVLIARDARCFTIAAPPRSDSLTA